MGRGRALANDARSYWETLDVNMDSMIPIPWMRQPEVICPQSVSHKPKEKTGVQFPQMKNCAAIPGSNVQHKAYSCKIYHCCDREYYSPSRVCCYNQHQVKHIRDFCGIRFEIYENILIVTSCGGVGAWVGAGMGADKGVAARGE